MKGEIAAKTWEWLESESGQLKFPTENTTTALRPDIILWSTSAQTVIMAELTAPWEGRMEAVFERKKDKYTELAVECKEAG